MAARTLDCRRRAARLPRRRTGAAARAASCAPPGGPAWCSARQRGAPVLADRLGREAHRLRRRRDRAGDRAALRRSCSASASCRTSGSARLAARGRRASASPASPSSRVQPVVGWWAVAGTLAVVLSSALVCAVGHLRPAPRRRPSPGPCSRPARCSAAGCSCFRSGSRSCPASPGWQASRRRPRARVLGTAFAQLVLYRMLRLHGARRVSLVTYLMPGFALVYGALLLDEPIDGAALLGGLALILAGVALGSGAYGCRARPPRRPQSMSISIRRAPARRPRLPRRAARERGGRSRSSPPRGRTVSTLARGGRSGLEREPEEFGRFVIEVDGERAGTMGFELANRRSASRTSAGSRSIRASAAAASATTRRDCCSAT